MLIDITYYKTKDWLHYGNKILFLVAGIRNDDYREILGAKLTDSEYSFFGRSNTINSRRLKKISPVKFAQWTLVKISNDIVFPS